MSAGRFFECVQGYLDKMSHLTIIGVSSVLVHRDRTLTTERIGSGGAL